MLWFVQLALAAHYMHSQSILHQDIKTQNVFILSSGRVVLGDLGISKVSCCGNKILRNFKHCLLFLIPIAFSLSSLWKGIRTSQVLVLVSMQHSLDSDL